MGPAHSLIKKFPHKCASRLILQRHFLNYGFLFSDNSRLCHVNNQNNLDSVEVRKMAPQIDTCCISLATWVQSQSWRAEWTQNLLTSHTSCAPTTNYIHIHKKILKTFLRATNVCAPMKCFFFCGCEGCWFNRRAQGKQRTGSRTHVGSECQSLLCGPHPPSLALP